MIQRFYLLGGLALRAVALGRGFCLGAGKTRSQKNASKSRRIPSVKCTKKERGSFFTLCWLAFFEFKEV
jgi:hypothetical protein